MDQGGVGHLLGLPTAEVNPGGVGVVDDGGVGRRSLALPAAEANPARLRNVHHRGDCQAIMQLPKYPDGRRLAEWFNGAQQPDRAKRSG